MIDVTSYILSKFPDKSPNASGAIHTQCPFHNDRSPSFSINIHSGLFICGSVRCGVKGNFAKFYKLMENCSWDQVYKSLKETTTDFDVSEFLEKKKENQLKTVYRNEFPPLQYLEDLKVVEYLRNRGLGKNVINYYDLKYGAMGEFDGINIQGSIVAPVFDLKREYRTFQVRYLHDFYKMRWGNPSNSPIQSLLYGGWLITDRTKNLYVVEGASDVWNMFNLEAQAVGLNTKTASSQQILQIEDLCKFFGLTPVVCLDGDVRQKGKSNNLFFDEKLFFELRALNLQPKIVELEPNEDPGNLSRERFLEINGSI